MGWAIFRTAIIWLVGTTLGRGILHALNAKGYHPETWVSRMIGNIIPAKKKAASIPWILAGIFGLLVIVGWETFHVTERLERLWPSSPPTLRSLFDDDLNNSGMVIEPNNDMPILINGSRRLIRIKFVFDPVSRGYFIAFLLLQGEANYETSHWIGENFDAALRPFKIFMGGVITLPGDATGTRQPLMQARASSPHTRPLV